MSRILDLGRRLELQPLDRHGAGISVALYERRDEAGPQFKVHTYSSRPGAAERISIKQLAFAAIVLTLVPPSTTPKLRVVFGSFGRLTSSPATITRLSTWIALGLP